MNARIVAGAAGGCDGGCQPSAPASFTRSVCGRDIPQYSEVRLDGSAVTDHIVGLTRGGRRGKSPDAGRHATTSADEGLVGPLGLEPRTKGFTLTPPFPVGVDYLFTPALFVDGGAGRSSLSLSALASAQVVSAPSGGAPPAWLRVAISRAVKVSLNSSRPLRTSRCEGTILDESPALTN